MYSCSIPSTVKARSICARVSQGRGPVNTRIPCRSPHFVILPMSRAWMPTPISMVNVQNDCTGSRCIFSRKPSNRLMSLASS